MRVLMMCLHTHTHTSVSTGKVVMRVCAHVQGCRRAASAAAAANCKRTGEASTISACHASATLLQPRLKLKEQLCTRFIRRPHPDVLHRTGPGAVQAGVLHRESAPHMASVLDWALLMTPCSLGVRPRSRATQGARTPGTLPVVTRSVSERNREQQGETQSRRGQALVAVQAALLLPPRTLPALHRNGSTGRMRSCARGGGVPGLARGCNALSTAAYATYRIMLAGIISVRAARRCLRPPAEVAVQVMLLPTQARTTF